VLNQVDPFHAHCDMVPSLGSSQRYGSRERCTGSAGAGQNRPGPLPAAKAGEPLGPSSALAA